MFATKERLPVTVDESGNRIWLCKGLSVKVQAAVQDASVTIHLNQLNTKSGEVMVGAFKRALLQAYVVGWDGPAFAGVKCNAMTIDELDAQDPLVEKAAQEAATLYTKATTPDPKETLPQVIVGTSYSLETLQAEYQEETVTPTSP